jgi:chromosome segregation ATPase
VTGNSFPKELAKKTNQMDQMLEECYEALHGAWPSSMIQALAKEIIQKHEVEVTQILQFLDNLLDGFLNRTQIVITQEYIPELRSAFFSLQESEVKQRLSIMEKEASKRIHQSEKHSGELNEKLKPLYEEINRLTELLGIETGKTTALTAELNILRKELVVKGEEGLLMSANHFREGIEELAQTVRRLEKDNKELTTQLDKAKEGNHFLSKQFSELKHQQDITKPKLTKCQTKLDKALNALAEIKGYAHSTAIGGRGDALKNIQNVITSALEEN